MGISTVIFDLGNVLFDFHPLKAAKNFLTLTRLRKTPQEIIRFFQESEVETAYCEGRVSTQIFYEHVREELGIRNDFEAFRKYYCDIFVENKQTIALVKRLKKKGMKLGILSNTNELHIEFLVERSNIFSLFDEIIYSYSEHCQKPDEKIYRIALERLDCRPEETLFIDDLAENIDAAVDIGINGHVFTTAKKCEKYLKENNVL